MKFAVVGQHRDFLRQYHWIDFEGVLSSAQLTLLQKEIDALLVKRFKISPYQLYEISAEKKFANGRDLWRDSAQLKKLLLSKTLAEVASELIEYKPLRFGFDLLLPSMAHVSSAHNPYSNLLTKSLSLQDMSSIQGIRCGLMLCLQAPPKTVESVEEAPSSIFSMKAGHGVFFLPDTPIPFAELARRRDYTYLLLAYTESKAVYRHEENDPHVNEFKRLGYNFGDKLSDVLNPLVYS